MKEEQKRLITEIMNDDAKDGLYKQTAVDWIVLQLYEKMQMKGDGNIFDQIMLQAKQMEIEQMREQRLEGYKEGIESASAYYPD